MFHTLYGKFIRSQLVDKPLRIKWINSLAEYRCKPNLAVSGQRCFWCCSRIEAGL